MKVVAAVLTWNLYETGRRDLFERTIASLRGQVDELLVVDNNSTDGTRQLLEDGQDQDEWRVYRPPHIGNTTSGYGTHFAVRLARAAETDALCVVSDDDMEWKPDARERLEDWWVHSPSEVVLTGGHLEPEFGWNSITDTVTYGTTKGFLRASTGAASWTFLTERYDLLRGALRYVPTKLQGTWDVPVCQYLRVAGWAIGQIDAAEHIGQGRSSWGNGTEQLYGWDVGPVRARLTAEAKA